MTARTEHPGRTTSLLLLLLGVSFPAVQLVKTMVDRATTVRDVTGAVHFVSEGQAAQLLQLGLVVGGAAVAVHLGIRGLRAGRVSVSSWAVLALVVLVAEALRGRADTTTLVYAALTVVLLTAAGTLRLEGRDIGLVGLVVGGTAASNLVFAVLNPERGWATCRAEKCSVAGGLLRGYFPQENVLGVFLVTLLPAVAYVRHPVLRWGSVALVVVAVVLTGSRTATAAIVLGLWAYAVVRRRATPGRDHGDAAKVAALFPLGTFLVSTVLLVSLPDMALTGRGLIFRIVREAWRDEPLLGPGRESLYDAYYSSMANWYLAHEHGQAAYALNSAGLLGMLLMVVALVGIVRASWVSGGALPALFALVPALGFLTEPTWEVSARGPYLVSLLLTVTLTAQALRREPLPVPAAPAPGATREPVAPGGDAVGELRATLGPAHPHSRSDARGPG